MDNTKVSDIGKRMEEVNRLKDIFKDDKKYLKSDEGKELQYLYYLNKQLKKYSNKGIKGIQRFNASQKEPRTHKGICEDSSYAKEIEDKFKNEDLAKEIRKASWGKEGLERAIKVIDKRIQKLINERRDLQEKLKQASESNTELVTNLNLIRKVNEAGSKAFLDEAIDSRNKVGEYSDEFERLLTQLDTLRTKENPDKEDVANIFQLLEKISDLLGSIAKDEKNLSDNFVKLKEYKNRVDDGKKSEEKVVIPMIKKQDKKNEKILDEAA